MLQDSQLTAICLVANLATAWASPDKYLTFAGAVTVFFAYRLLRRLVKGKALRYETKI